MTQPRWFAATGFCIMADGPYWLGAEPRLAPEIVHGSKVEILLSGRWTCN